MSAKSGLVKHYIVVSQQINILITCADYLNHTGFLWQAEYKAAHGEESSTNGQTASIATSATSKHGNHQIRKGAVMGKLGILKLKTSKAFILNRVNASQHESYAMILLAFFLHFNPLTFFPLDNLFLSSIFPFIIFSLYSSFEHSGMLDWLTWQACHIPVLCL